MPEMPRYNSERQLTTEPPSQMYREVDVGAEGKALTKMAVQAQDVSIKLNEFYKSAKNTQAELNLKISHAKLEQEASLDTDVNGYSNMSTRADQLFSESTKGLSDPNQIAKLRTENELFKIKLGGEYKKKVLDKDRANTLQFIDMEINSPTGSLDRIRSFLEEKVKIGTYSKEDAYKLERKANEELGVGKFNADLSEATTPELVELVKSKLASGGYEKEGVMIDPEKKRALLDIATSAKNSREKEIENKNKEIQQQRTNDLIDKIASGTWTIKDIENEESIPEKNGGIPRKQLLSLKDRKLRGIEQDLNQMLQEKTTGVYKESTQRAKAIKQYTDLIDNFIDTETDATKAKELLVNAYKDGILNDKEIKVLNDMKNSIKSIEFFRKTDPVSGYEAFSSGPALASSIKGIYEFMKRQSGYSEEDAVLKIKQLVTGVANGMPVETVSKQIMNEPMIKRFPNYSNYPKTGKLIIDSNGNKARIYPDGTWEPASGKE